MNARRLILVVLVAALGGLTFTADPALAAGPEEPVTIEPAKSITGTSALFEGTLNPHSFGKVGGYFGFSNPEGLLCIEGPAVGLEGVEGELEGQALSVHAKASLEPGRKYQFCLIAFNELGEVTPGNEVTVETPALPPTIEGESASGVKAGGATLGATINANNQTTTYTFEYAEKEKAGALEGTIVKVLAAPPAPLEGFGGRAVSAPTEALAPHTTYYYRVVAENAQSKKEGTPAEGKVEHFITGPLETPEGLKAEPVGATTATLRGVLNLAGAVNPGSYEFIYQQSAGGYEQHFGSCEGEGQRTTPAEPAVGVEGEEAKAEITGLLPNAQYAFCLRETNKAGEEALSAPVTFTTTTEAPTIGGESSSGVGSTEATVSAQIEAGGTPSTYYVEYGTSAPYARSATVSLAAGSTSVEVQKTLSGLQPGVEYHFRFVAANVLGSERGADATFVTSFASSVSSSALPDGRVYELVFSPTNPEEREVYVPITEEREVEEYESAHPIEAASNGDAIVYVAESSPTEGSGEEGPKLGNEYLAEHSPGGGWGPSVDLTPRDEIGNGGAYTSFSSDLSTATLYSGFPLAAGVSGEKCATLYTRRLENGVYGSPQPLFTQWPLNPGEYPEETCNYPDPIFQNSVYPVLHFAGESADSSRTFFETTKVLTSEAPHQSRYTSYDLYESEGGQVRLVNVMPDGRPQLAGGAKFGGTSGDIFPRHAVSEDGENVFWTDTSGDPGLYVREDSGTPAAKTVLISQGGEFQTASSNGKYAFYIENGGLYRFDVQTGERLALTSAAPAAAGTGDLDGVTGSGTLTKGSNLITGVTTATGAFAVGQVIEVEECPECFGPLPKSEPPNTITAVGPGTLELARAFNLRGQQSLKDGLLAGSEEITSVSTTTGAFRAGEPIFGAGIVPGTTITEVTPNALRLSKLPAASGAGVAIATGGPEVQGVLGSSEDGSYLYFAAKGVLANNENANGETAQRGHEEGKPNLYLYHEGSTRFIATLASSDNFDWTAGEWLTNPYEPAEEAPSMLYTAEATPDGHDLVFSSTRKLTGYENASAHCIREAGLDSVVTYSPGSCTEVYLYDADSGKLVCTSCALNGAPPTEGGGFLSHPTDNTHLPRWINEEGSEVFFQTAEGLVPQDDNGAVDVYEWERDGAGSCRQSTGCIYLLSGGSSPEGSWFLDADAKGENVFFASREHLVAAHQGDDVALYDARVNGYQPVSPPACTGTGCQGTPPAQPIFATPASVTFAGVGNFLPGPPPTVVKSKTKRVKCSRGKKLSHGKCVKLKARKRPRKAKKATRASGDRRASR
jgi:hypothetical protein